jgi:hypothetical protein
LLFPQVIIGSLEESDEGNRKVDGSTFNPSVFILLEQTDEKSQGSCYKKNLQGDVLKLILEEFQEGLN